MIDGKKGRKRSREGSLFIVGGALAKFHRMDFQLVNFQSANFQSSLGRTP